MRRHSGAALASNSGGTCCGAVAERLEKVAGERWFSSTPPGPIRKYGSSS
jgi:hypothetical protein